MQQKLPWILFGAVLTLIVQMAYSWCRKRMALRRRLQLFYLDRQAIFVRTEPSFWFTGTIPKHEHKGVVMKIGIFSMCMKPNDRCRWEGVSLGDIKELHPLTPAIRRIS